MKKYTDMDIYKTINSENKIMKQHCITLAAAAALFFLPMSLPIMLEIPVSKWSRINLNNSTFEQSLSTNQLIVGGIVNHTKNTSLLGHSLTAPWEISSVQPQSSPLDVPTTNPNPSNSLVAWYDVLPLLKNEQSCLPSSYLYQMNKKHTIYQICLENRSELLSFLPPSLLFASCGTPFVHRIARNTHACN